MSYNTQQQSEAQSETTNAASEAAPEANSVTTDAPDVDTTVDPTSPSPADRVSDPDGFAAKYDTPDEFVLADEDDDQELAVDPRGELREEPTGSSLEASASAADDLSAGSSEYGDVGEDADQTAPTDIVNHDFGTTKDGQPVHGGVDVEKRGKYALADDLNDCFGVWAKIGTPKAIHKGVPNQVQIEADNLGLDPYGLMGSDTAMIEQIIARERELQEISQRTPDKDEWFATNSSREAWEDHLEEYAEFETNRTEENREAVSQFEYSTCDKPSPGRYSDDPNRQEPQALWQARVDAYQDYRPFHFRHTDTRSVHLPDPTWGDTTETTIDTTEMVLGGETVTVATGDVTPPIPVKELEREKEVARKQRLSADKLELIDQYAVRMFDKILEYAGIEQDEDSFEAIPRDEADIRIPTFTEIRDAYEQAYVERRNEFAAIERAFELLYHQEASQPLSDIKPYWVGCTARVRVTDAYVPSHESQRQVLEVADANPHDQETSMGGQTAKLTIFKKSGERATEDLEGNRVVYGTENSNTMPLVGIGDELLLHNAKPSSYNGQLTLAVTTDSQIDVVRPGDGEIIDHKTPWHQSSSDDDEADSSGASEAEDTEPKTIEEDPDYSPVTHSPTVQWIVPVPSWSDHQPKAMADESVDATMIDLSFDDKNETTATTVFNEPLAPKSEVSVGEIEMALRSHSADVQAFTDFDDDTETDRCMFELTDVRWEGHHIEVNTDIPLGLPEIPDPSVATPTVSLIDSETGESIQTIELAYVEHFDAVLSRIVDHLVCQVPTEDDTINLDWLDACECPVCGEAFDNTHELRGHFGGKATAGSLRHRKYDLLLEQLAE